MINLDSVSNVLLFPVIGASQQILYRPNPGASKELKSSNPGTSGIGRTITKCSKEAQSQGFRKEIGLYESKGHFPYYLNVDIYRNIYNSYILIDIVLLHYYNIHISAIDPLLILRPAAVRIDN
jgi:hypothetical protein